MILVECVSPGTIGLAYRSFLALRVNKCPKPSTSLCATEDPLPQKHLKPKGHKARGQDRAKQPVRSAGIAPPEP